MYNPLLANPQHQVNCQPVHVNHWVQVVDRTTGRVYYYNSVTRVSQWEPPTYEQLYTPQQPNLLYAYNAAQSLRSHPHGKLNPGFPVHLQQGQAAQQCLQQESKAFLGDGLGVGGVFDEQEEIDAEAKESACEGVESSVNVNVESADVCFDASEHKYEEFARCTVDRCWGRPNGMRPVMVECDEATEEVHRFRSISSIEPTTIVRLATIYNKKSGLDDGLTDMNMNEHEDHHGGTGIMCRDRANTTNSQYRSRLSSTIFQPDAEDQLRCVSVVLHAHMISFAKSMSWNHESRKRTVFDGTGNCTIDSIPTQETVFKFMNKIFKSAEMLKETIIMALIYLERLLKDSNGKLNIHLNNWRSLVLICMLIASKVWDDLSMQNGDFSKICPEYSLKHINELEVVFLETIEYRVRVPSSTYAKYYFQLRAIGIGLGQLPSAKLENPTESTHGYSAPGGTLRRGRGRRQTYVEGASPEL